MVPASAGLDQNRSVTAALTGPKTVVVCLNGRNLSIMHGEHIGMIMGLILSSPEHDTANEIIHNDSDRLGSDHLNTVRFVEDARSKIDQTSKLRNMNGRSYLRWIANLVKKSRTTVTHVKSHTDNQGLDSLLNSEADHYASNAHSFAHTLHPAPIPTFYMDDFTFYRPEDGWIESDIPTFTDHFLSRTAARNISIGHGEHMATWLYDPRPPPEYPYTRAASAYTALVQWYARSGQLPTAESIRRKNDKGDVGEYGRCRFGCEDVEDVHHIFFHCDRFEKWRNEAKESILGDTRGAIERTGIEEACMGSFLRKAKSFFIDCPNTWPLNRTAFYLGHVPKLDGIETTHQFESRLAKERFLHAIHVVWHTAGIRLASRIWGEVQREMARRKDTVDGYRRRNGAK